MGIKGKGGHFVKVAEDPMENYTIGEFLRTRTRDEFFIVNRFMQWMLESHCDKDAPLWEKSETYDRIMDEPMNWGLWEDAHSSNSKHYSI